MTDGILPKKANVPTLPRIVRVEFKMFPDPIVDEIRRIRMEHAAKYDNDLDRIVDALRMEERKSNRPLLNPGPRRLAVEKVSEARAPYHPPENDEK